MHYLCCYLLMWLILYVDTHVHLSYYYPTAVVYSLNAIVTGHGPLGSDPQLYFYHHRTQYR